MPDVAETTSPSAAGASGRGRRVRYTDPNSGSSRNSMIAMVIFTTAANVLNYASSIVFSRVLEPVGFGELVSLLALSVVLAVPLGAAQTVVAERVAAARAAEDEERMRYLVRYALSHVAVLALATGAVYAACIPLVVEAVGIREPGPAIALVPLIVFTFVQVVSLGVLQGLHRFAAFGAMIFGAAVARLAFGVPWAVNGGGAGGAIAGQAAGILLVHILLAWRYRHIFIGRGTGAATQGAKRRLDVASISASTAFVAFALLSNLDVVLARVFLDSRDAGIYAAVATVAKVVTFLPSAVTVIMVPNAARAQLLTGSSTRVLRLAGAVTASTAVLCLIPALVAPETIVQLMFGDEYADAVDGVVPAVLAGAGLAMLYLLCTYSVAIRDRRWVTLVVTGVPLQLLAIALFHDTPAQVAWAQAAVCCILLLGNELRHHSLIWPRDASTT